MDRCPTAAGRLFASGSAGLWPPHFRRREKQVTLWGACTALMTQPSAVVRAAERPAPGGSGLCCPCGTPCERRKAEQERTAPPRNEQDSGQSATGQKVSRNRLVPRLPPHQYLDLALEHAAADNLDLQEQVAVYRQMLSIAIDLIRERTKEVHRLTVAYHETRNELRRLRGLTGDAT